MAAKRPPEDVSLDDLSSEEMEMVKNWYLPEVENDGPKPNKTTAMGRSVDWYYGRKQREQEAIDNEPEEVKPLTLEEIEAIRESAYQEGLLQGNEEGYEKGHAKGLEKGYADGLEKGKEEGIATGLEEGRAIIETQAARWQELTHQLNTPLIEFNEVVEKQLVELAVELAQAVIGVEVKTNQNIIFQTLKESVEALPFNDSQCEISLNPEDLALVKAQFSDQDLTDKGWHIKSEPVIEQGGCIVESRTSSIDRTLKSRVENTIERFLTESGIKDDE